MNYSDLPTAEVDRSQFIGNSHQLLSSFFCLTFPSRAGVLVLNTKIFFLRHIPKSSWFSLVALMVKNAILRVIPQRAILNPEGQDIIYLTRKSWGFVIHPEFVFTLPLKSIPDVILKAWLTIPTIRVHSLFALASRREGGEFRDSVKKRWRWRSLSKSCRHTPTVSEEIA
ncbi:MAG: hypothetical protein V7K38_25345 [Nostoc sp.]|uniref:hypothetical protein n=1 Tax=Nostoc sp. TaxID=1180 RepID=UPI002FFB8761